MPIKKERVAENFAKAARAYDAHATFQAQIAQRLWESCAESIAPSSLILDVGCGTARLWSGVSKHRVIGIDSAFDMCRHAPIATANAAMESLPFADESCDVVFSSYAMQWTPSLDAAIAESLRVLKSSGLLAIAVPIEGTLHELHDSFEQAGLASHVMAFRNIEKYLKNPTLKMITHSVLNEKLRYDSPLALIRTIKAMGAATATNPKRKGMMTPRQLIQIEDYYRTHYSEGKEVIASWNTLIMIARK